MVRAKKLTKRFGSVVALDSVDLEIPGGLTVVVGPNGGGKSTFMKIATGAYRPSGGCIEVLGKDPWRDEGVKKRLGASFDPPALPPLRTGREWLEYVSEARGGNGRDVTEAAETFGIEGFVDKRVRDYSAGMRKRVSLAQAFVGDPELVFLDEPLANLDLEGMKNVVGVIQRKHEEGLNLVVISHIWRPFLEMADYAVFIAAGRVQASGDPDEVLPLIEGAFPL
ncbi:ABC transporter [Thermococcus celer]|uniref:ABC transporter n=1 Tax=Thermococcus celer Vu 13 = JCM 8558 TaxID=1293037 RepID=A0A218P4R5_THECE|nr:ABC transporter ATP-binding protein [Thermococcus celer]ASI99929.1 ABC transporter [Thermococcus celer] [Thermococcus celer Vu 13 = JCM 8558]